MIIRTSRKDRIFPTCSDVRHRLFTGFYRIDPTNEFRFSRRIGYKVSDPSSTFLSKSGYTGPANRLESYFRYEKNVSKRSCAVQGRTNPTVISFSLRCLFIETRKSPPIFFSTRRPIFPDESRRSVKRRDKNVSCQIRYTMYWVAPETIFVSRQRNNATRNRLRSFMRPLIPRHFSFVPFFTRRAIFEEFELGELPASVGTARFNVYFLRNNGKIGWVRKVARFRRNGRNLTAIVSRYLVADIVFFTTALFPPRRRATFTILDKIKCRESCEKNSEKISRFWEECESERVKDGGRKG